MNQPPTTSIRAFQQPIDTLGRLTTPEQFGEIIIKEIDGTQNVATPQIVRLKDVARVEMGAANYNLSNTFDGQPLSDCRSISFPAPTPWTSPTERGLRWNS